MAKCKRCGKSSLALFLSNDGYCKSCAEKVSMVQKREEQKRLEAEQAEKQKKIVSIIASEQERMAAQGQVYSPYQMKQRNQIKDTSKSYFENMDKLESMWAVVSNLRAYYSEAASELETLCYQNISEYHSMIAFEKIFNPDYVQPPRVPAYVRLAMLYEKREDYVNAIDVCVAAIKAGATADGTNGKMYGRLARMIRKSGIEVDPGIMQLVNPQEETK
mgnify:CR=1 FL=1